MVNNQFLKIWGWGRLGKGLKGLSRPDDVLPVKVIYGSSFFQKGLRSFLEKGVSQFFSSIEI